MPRILSVALEVTSIIAALHDTPIQTEPAPKWLDQWTSDIIAGEISITRMPGKQRLPSTMGLARSDHADRQAPPAVAGRQDLRDRSLQLALHLLHAARPVRLACPGPDSQLRGDWPIGPSLRRLGASKLRITGGEPLLRNGLPELVGMLASVDGIEDICLTTNGLLLADAATDLRRAGLDRVTVSLDSMDPDTFVRMAQRGRLDSVLAGIAAAKAAGLGPIKINTVVERGVNDREIHQLVDYARTEGFEIRFIEYMDVGNVNDWTAKKLVTKAEILARVSESHPFKPVVSERGSAPAVRYRFEDGSGGFGVIASVTEPFCGACTRARLTADGRLVTCLFSPAASTSRRCCARPRQIANCPRRSLPSGKDGPIDTRKNVLWRSHPRKATGRRLCASSK